METTLALERDKHIFMWNYGSGYGSKYFLFRNASK
jgi:3-hydroxy-3-methylglutaryl CoA synthase